MRTVIVLAMHGSPARDFPREELAEFFRLRGRRGTHAHATGEAAARLAELEERIRSWPRTVDNDTYYSGAQAIAQALRCESGLPVIVGFNEFCAPSLEEAVDQAALLQPDRVVVMTTMLTRGGTHAESDIPSAIDRARQRHPDLDIVYAWPFDPTAVARFLSEHARRFQ